MSRRLVNVLDSTGSCCGSGMNRFGFYTPCSFPNGHGGPHSFEHVTAEYVVNLINGLRDEFNRAAETQEVKHE